MSEDLPTYQNLIGPLFRVLADRPDGIPTSEAYEEVADRVGLTEDQRAQMLSSRSQPVYENRIGWAHDRLKRAGLSHSKEHGIWQLTEEGFRLDEAYPEGLPRQVLEQIAKSGRSDFHLTEHLPEAGGTPEDDGRGSDSREPENFTAAEAAKVVLADADEPLHYKEITRRVLDQGLWHTDGDSPAATMVSVLSVDIKD